MSNWVITEEIAILREVKSGWRQEFNKVSWHGKEPKYDIRWWSPDRMRSGKGVTLREKDLAKVLIEFDKRVIRESGDTIE